MNNGPDRFEKAYLGTSVRYLYNTYRIHDQDPSRLEGSNNPFSMVILIVRTALEANDAEDEQLFRLKVKLLKLLAGKQFVRRKTEAILVFLKNYIRFKNNDFNIKFEKEIDNITGRKTFMGIKEFVLERAKHAARIEGLEEGRQEGREEERAELARNLLLQTDFISPRIAHLLGVEIEFVERIKSRMA